MTSIQQFIKDLQEKFPNQMKDMWENNQFLIEDITLKAKQMHKQEMIEFATEYDEYCHKSFVQNQYKSIKSAEQYYKNTYEKEN